MQHDEGDSAGHAINVIAVQAGAGRLRFDQDPERAREIAADLVVEDATVRSHIRRILMKLQLRDRIQIVTYAYETGVIRPAPGARPH